MQACLLKRFLDDLRLKAIYQIRNAFAKQIDVSKLTEWLLFNNDDETISFLEHLALVQIKKVHTWDGGVTAKAFLKEEDFDTHYELLSKEYSQLPSNFIEAKQEASNPISRKDIICGNSGFKTSLPKFELIYMAS